MGKLLDIKSRQIEPRTDLAAEVAPKLEAARIRLAELEDQQGAAALAATLDEAGAASRLAQLNNQIDCARRERAQLEVAHRVAVHRDAMAKAAIESKARRTQLAAFEKVGAERLKAWRETCEGLAAAAEAYTRFIELTDEMAVAMPTGTVQQTILWRMADTIVADGGAFPATLDVLLGAEMFRNATNPSRALLPGARPPTETQRYKPASIEPAVASIERMNQYLVGLVRGKLDAIEQAENERLWETA
jgi:hypothetical protein